MNFLHTGRISLDSVAENIITCFSWGVDRNISWTSRRMSENEKLKMNKRCHQWTPWLNTVLTVAITIFLRKWFCFARFWKVRMDGHVWKRISLQKLFHKNVFLPSCSSILSHSSRMKCFRFFRLSFLLLTRARILPGVPTTMWGQLDLSTCSSLEIAMPPKNTPTYKWKMSVFKTVNFRKSDWKDNFIRKREFDL